MDAGERSSTCDQCVLFCSNKEQYASPVAGAPPLEGGRARWYFSAPGRTKGGHLRKINTNSFTRATRSTPREINRKILLNLVREHQPISRADLARRMRVGRGMVTSLVSELLDAGELRDGATVDAPRGRRPRMLYVRTHDRMVIAIDVRFSVTYVMLSDFSGAPIAIESFETVTDPAMLVAELAPRIRRLLGGQRPLQRCEGIGLVVPGMIDQATGRVLNAPQLGWRDISIRDALARATKLPVYIENAPIACALSQLWLGQRGEANAGDFVYVTVGDGVGAAIVVNGEVIRGQGNTAGEFGHLSLSLDGPQCLCGSTGCLEAYTSNLATLSRYLGQQLSPTATRTLLHESGLTVDDVIARARSGDARAREAIEATGRYLGLGIASIVTALNPRQIYVGGEITSAWDLVEPEIRAAISRRALTKTAAATLVIPDPASGHPRLRGGVTLVSARRFAAPRLA